MKTFWLYYNGNPIDAARLPTDSTPDQVRAHAVAWHERVPLCDRPYENPLDRHFKLLASEVRS